MAALFQDWLSLFFRWAHIIAAISWIGSSFYFMWLDSSLKRRATLGAGVKGENWTVHGGGFYHTVKYQVAPEGMPEDLHWFRWESYMTWLTGFALLAVTYYWSAEGLLIDRSVMDLSPSQAIAISLASLAFGWLAYDRLCTSRLRHRPDLMIGVLFLALVALAWALQQVFSPRAAWLHVGAILATMMSGNVFFIIIPNQRIVVADLKAGRTPDPGYGEIAKLRSTHNNYLTLPVVLMMISNHYPVAFGHPQSWVLIAIILAIGAVVRQWFNAHESGAHGLKMHWQWPVAAFLAILLMWFSSWRPDLAAGLAAAVEPARAVEVVSLHCSSCHARAPSDPAFDAAPGGVHFDDLGAIRAHSAKIMAQAVLSEAMPLGNETGMTVEERAILGAWLQAGAPSP